MTTEKITNTTGTNNGTGGAGSGGGGSGNGDNQPTECDMHPDTVGCMKPGVYSDAANLGQSTVNIGSTSTTVFASATGCPAPLTFTVIGHVYAISYAPICDRLAVLKAIFLVMAGVMSAYIIADGFRV